MGDVIPLRSQRAPHILNLTLDPDSLCEDHREPTVYVRGCTNCDTPVSFDASIECPGIDVGRCSSWLECSSAHEGLPEDNDGAVLHGVEHQIIGGLLMVQVDGCFVQDLLNWGGNDDAHDIGFDHGPGRYEIDWDGGLMEDAVLLYVGPADENRSTS